MNVYKPGTVLDNVHVFIYTLNKIYGTVNIQNLKED